MSKAIASVLSQLKVHHTKRKIIRIEHVFELLYFRQKFYANVIIVEQTSGCAIFINHLCFIAF